MQLNNLEYTKGSRNHKRKIVGRGHGSGIGKTSGRGQDGQKSRKSPHTRLGFEGGQTPLYRRVQKVGFNNYEFANKYFTINLKDISKLKEKNIDVKLLCEKGFFPRKNILPLKVIGNEKIPSGMVIKANKITAGAIKAIENSGSKFELLE